MDQTKQRTYPFCVEVNKKLYQCERVVTGNDRLTQSITVRGEGTELDRTEYGSGVSPVIAMEGTATLIAMRIVQKTIPNPV